MLERIRKEEDYSLMIIEDKKREKKKENWRVKEDKRRIL